MPVPIHTFDDDCDTSEAYDITQVTDSIIHGTVLVVPLEKVVGIMVGAWPVAITIERNAFHGVNTPSKIEETCQSWTNEDAKKEWLKQKPDYLASLAEARRIADEKEWPRI